MAMFAYRLENPSAIETVDDLKHMIMSACSHCPNTLYACVSSHDKTLAYRICCQSDIIALKKICQDQPISIVYSPVLASTLIPFRGFYQDPVSSYKGADFMITAEAGEEDGGEVKVNTQIWKKWDVELAGNYRNLTVKCVEGDFVGVYGGVEVSNGKAVVWARGVTPGEPKWCSSMWRLFTDNKAFGPWLWIEVKVVD